MNSVRKKEIDTDRERERRRRRRRRDKCVNETKVGSVELGDKSYKLRYRVSSREGKEEVKGV
jgi:hypothetical protein